MIFTNREEAALLLVKKLKKYAGLNPLILGIPRGAIPMAKIIAEGLQGELSAVLVHKISAPHNPEFAIGCVGLSGHIYRSSYVSRYGIDEDYIAAAAKKELEVLRRRKRDYDLKEVNYKNRIVIIVDDGIATGATTMCAVQEVLAQEPKRLIVASAVSAIDSASKIERLVDELVVLDRPSNFFSVGQFFDHFSQVSDEEVISALRSFRAGPDQIAV